MGCRFGDKILVVKVLVGVSYFGADQLDLTWKLRLFIFQISTTTLVASSIKTNFRNNRFDALSTAKVDY